MLGPQSLAGELPYHTLSIRIVSYGLRSARAEPDQPARCRDSINVLYNVAQAVNLAESASELRGVAITRLWRGSDRRVEVLISEVARVSGLPGASDVMGRLCSARVLLHGEWPMNEHYHLGRFPPGNVSAEVGAEAKRPTKGATLLLSAQFLAPGGSVVPGREEACCCLRG